LDYSVIITKVTMGIVLLGCMQEVVGSNPGGASGDRTMCKCLPYLSYLMFSNACGLVVSVCINSVTALR